MRIAISPSSQEHNECKMGDTEQAHCRLIARRVTELLQSAGQDAHLLLVGDDNLSDADQLVQMAAASNALHPDLHIDIHTDAGGATGPTTFYTGVGRSRDLARAVHAEVAATVPWPGGGCYDRSGLYMLRKTSASAILVECWPHDRMEQASWGHAHIDDVAAAIARSVLKITGGDLPAGTPTNTTVQEDDMPALDTQIISAVDGQPYRYVDYIIADNRRITEIEGSMLTLDTKITDTDGETYKLVDYIIADNRRITELSEKLDQVLAALQAGQQ